MRQKLIAILTEIGIERKAAEVSALNICKFLEDELDLAGNGWFDDDPVVLKALGFKG